MGREKDGLNTDPRSLVKEKNSLVRRFEAQIGRGRTHPGRSQTQVCGNHGSHAL